MAEVAAHVTDNVLPHLTLPRSLGGQERVATHDQSLAGIVLRSDLREIDFIEQRELQVSLIQEASDRRSA